MGHKVNSNARYTYDEYKRIFGPAEKSLDHIIDPDEFIAAARARLAQLKTMAKYTGVKSTQEEEDELCGDG